MARAAPNEELEEFGVHIEQVLELDEVEDEDEQARQQRQLQGRKSIHKQDATIQMVKWTNAAITTRKKVLKEVDEDEPSGLDSFEEDYLKNLLTIQEFEHKFRVLARRWRRFLNFYGLIEDVNLLLVEGASGGPACGSSRRVGFASATTAGKSHEPQTRTKKRSKCSLEELSKLFWLLIILWANLITIYMLTAHFAWELRRLDAKMSTYEAIVTSTRPASSNSSAAGEQPNETTTTTQLVRQVTFNGWSILKDFLENLRRHLSRFFALVLIFIWHKNCHKFELLFADCRRYYAAFYPKLSSLGISELWHTTQSARARGREGSIVLLGADGGEGQPPDDESGLRSRARSARSRSAAKKIRVILTIREHQLQLIEATSRFYELARRRIWLAVLFPFAHLAFNIVGILLSPGALIIANNGHAAALPPNRSTSSLLVSNSSSITDRLLENFETYHLAVHTAFHPVDHQIGQSPNGTTTTTTTTTAGQLSWGWSAAYCLAELFSHYVYVNGPRIVCATCLSLVLSIHHQCLRAFNKHLTKLIRRSREAPLSRWDMVKLLKQYDMIGMMHERIESTFKWSLVSWFSLMFISCLMLIFTLTESTSAALTSTIGASPAGPAGRGATPTDALETVCAVAILLARIFFVCYAPLLIYSEAFNIEFENSRANQLIMLLARRQDDPVAQAIEPSLFEPIQLSVGGFFQLSKKSVAPLLGAIVTFSIMFIGPDGDEPNGEGEDANEDEPDRGGGGGTDDSEDDDEPDESENELLDEEPTDEQRQDDDEEEDEEQPDDAAAGSQRRQASGAEVARAMRTAHDEQQQHLERAKPAGPAARDAQERSAAKARQWRKFKRLNRKIKLSSGPTISQPGQAKSQPTGGSGDGGENEDDQDQDEDDEDGDSDSTGREQLRPAKRKSSARTNSKPPPRAVRPRLAGFYLARLRENERQLSFLPKLRVENGIEICDFEIGPAAPDSLGSQQKAQQGTAAANLFAVTWIDRISGEVTVEATNLTQINCERQQNYTLRMRAVACNGLESNEAVLRVELEDVNEFSPEFERSSYALALDWSELRARQPPATGEQADDWCHLLTVRAHDQDCSAEFGQVCRYELVESAHGQAAGGPAQESPTTAAAAAVAATQEEVRQQQPPVATTTNSNLRVDPEGNLRARCRWLLNQPGHHLHLQVVAYDCGGKKSQRPAGVQVDIRHHNHHQQASVSAARLAHGLKRATQANDSAETCRPAWKDVDTQIAYRPASGERWPFLRAHLDLCSIKCHRPLNLTVKLQLEATPAQPDSGRAQSSQAPPTSSSIRQAGQQLAAGPVFHCDRDPYAMVSKRRLCGARRKTVELLPPLSAHTRWVVPLLAGRAASPARRRRTRPKVGGGGGTVGEAQNETAEARLAHESEPHEPEGPDQDEDAELGEADGQDVHEQARPPPPSPGKRPRLKLELELDEENLGAYLPDGSYGQLAREFVARNAPAKPDEPLTGEAGGQSTGQHVGEARAEAPARVPQDTRAGQPSRRQARATAAEWRHPRRSAIYRDQVYHFDGISDALIVPSSVYDDDHDEPQPGEKFPQKGNATTRILFGARHTLSFWMRHAEFRFKQQPGGRNESRRSADEADELLELSKHVREHLLCVSERRPAVRHDDEDDEERPSADSSFEKTERNSRSSARLKPQLRHLNHPHHMKQYAIFMKNCKLHLLMRHAERPDELSANQGNAAEPQDPSGRHEWRWSLAQTGQFCDNKWHLYTLNVNLPQVELYVDGQQFDTEKKRSTVGEALSAGVPAGSGRTAEQRERKLATEPEASKRTNPLVLTVGACWDAPSNSMVGHFRGALSGLNVLLRANDEANAIECLGRCTESLVSSAPQNDQQPLAAQDNSLVSYQEAQDRIQLQGHDPLDVEDALAQIAYVNRRQLPSIGRRTINVETTMHCVGGASGPHQVPEGVGPLVPQAHAAGLTPFRVPVESLKIEINVLPSTILPVISLSGTPNLAREHLLFAQGRVAPFESVEVQVRQVNLLKPVKNSQPLRPQGELPAGRQATMKWNNAQQFTADLLDYIDDATLNHPQHASRAHPGPEQKVGGQRQSQQQVSREASENLAAMRHRIESCHFQVRPPLNEDHESIQLPLEQLEQLDLYWRQSSSGAVIYGLDSAENYEALLRQILYKNERPNAYDERLFYLACSDMSGRLLSNEHLQRLTMIHPRPPVVYGAPQAPVVASRQQTMGVASELELELADDEDAAAGNLTERRFSSLRRAPGEHLTLIETSESLASLPSNKLNGVAVAFLVFVASLIVIVLIIAFANLGESTGSATRREERNKRLEGGTRRKSGLGRTRRALRCPMQGEEQECGGNFAIRRRHLQQSEGNRARYQRELELARADCYFAHDELTEPDYTSDEFEDEQEEDRSSVCPRRDAFGDKTAETTLCEVRGSGGARPLGMACQGRAGPLSPPSSLELDSLSWDDEFAAAAATCGHGRRWPGDPGATTTILINPLVHGLGSPAGGIPAAQSSKRALVASIQKPGDAMRPESHLVEPEASDGEISENSSAGVKSSPSGLTHDEQDDMLAMDEDMTSVCSRSRSCSTSSLASQTSEANSLNYPDEQFQERDQVMHSHHAHHFGRPIQSHAHHHFHHQQCPSSTRFAGVSFRHQQACGHRASSPPTSEERETMDEDEQLESEACEREQPVDSSYELYHRHHHRCLRALRSPESPPPSPQIRHLDDSRESSA